MTGTVGTYGTALPAVSFVQCVPYISSLIYTYDMFIIYNLFNISLLKYDSYMKK